MNITREVITDLLPLYLSGEASEDSRLLIQKYLEQDPEFAHQIELSHKDEFKLTAVPTPNKELAALNKTKRLLNLRSWLLGIALFLTASLFGIRDIGNGVEWLWTGLPWGFAVCLITAVSAWIAYMTLRHRLNRIGV